jgi:hypothetical protein
VLGLWMERALAARARMRAFWCMVRQISPTGKGSRSRIGPAGGASSASVLEATTPVCTAADVHMAASTNHSAYQFGKTVVMTSSVTNVSRA